MNRRGIVVATLIAATSLAGLAPQVDAATSKRTKKSTTTKKAAAPTTTATTPAKTGSLEGQTIVVSTFPFGIENFKKLVVEPFEKKTGAKVKLESGSNADRLTKLKLVKDKLGVDVMLISDYYAALGQSDKLFQQVDEKKVPNMADIRAFAREDAYAGPAYTYQLNGILYRTDKVTDEQAKSWGLFGDPKFSKKLALPNITVTAGQLTASGIGKEYAKGAYDMDGTLSVMGKWAPGILQFYSSTTEVSNLISQGEIVATPVLNAFAVPLIEAGQPVNWTIPRTGRFMATNRLMIPVGAPNMKGALAFIDYMLSPEAQAANAKTDLPVNPAAKPPALLVKIAGDAATNPVAAGYATLDPKVVVFTRDEWVSRFAREVVSRK